MMSMFAIPVSATVYGSEIEKTADRLVALQGTDGGWDWVVTGLTEHSGGSSAHNIYGVTALGLIDAYRITSNSSYYDAAKAAADHLLTVNRETTSTDRIQTFDYRFLVEFSVLSEDAQYGAHAIYQWSYAKTVSSLYEDENQEAFYGWYSAQYTSGFSVWQTADAGLAALAMGDTSWATDMAVVLASHLVDIAVDDDYRFIGWGHALELLQAVDSTGYVSKITSVIEALETSQVDGHWDAGQQEGGSQDTAYAVMGLMAVGRIDSAKVATDWLAVNQHEDGGWIGKGEDVGIEYSESDSEALQALCDLYPWEPEPEPVPEKPKPRRSIKIDWVLGLDSCNYGSVPHKLLVMYLDDTLFDEYYEVQVIIFDASSTIFNKTYGVFPKYDVICVYLPESAFTDIFGVIAYTELGPVPYIVASRQGIERSTTH